MATYRKYPRAKWYEYNDGIYFVTIVTHNRYHYFGEIVQGAMQLNNYGIIAQNEIEKISQRYVYIRIHNTVVMPNHIHLLLQIDQSNSIAKDNVGSRLGATEPHEQHQKDSCSHNVGSRLGATEPHEQQSIKIPTNPHNMGALHSPEHPYDDDLPFEKRNHFSSLLSTTICGLKSGITREIRKAGYDFHWQPRFHEHIVRNQPDYEKIYTYISENPMRWDNDVINV